MVLLVQCTPCCCTPCVHGHCSDRVLLRVVCIADAPGRLYSSQGLRQGGLSEVSPTCFPQHDVQSDADVQPMSAARVEHDVQPKLAWCSMVFKL